VEHDPAEIWNVTRGLLARACRGAGIKPAALAGIGITNQRETVVLWDRRTGNPVYRALVWQDRRTAEACARLREAGHEKMIRRKTGLVVDPYFSGTKIAWLLDNVKGLRRRAERGEIAFGTIDSWLIYNLTGGAVHATDHTNASRTLLYDIRKRAWDDELCKLLGVPREILPEIRNSAGDFGETASGVLGSHRIPVAGVAGDQQAALFGQACFKPGLVKNTYGTGCFLLMFVGDKPVASKNQLLTTVACAADGSPAYALEGSVFIAGAAVQWLRDGLRVIGKAPETEAAARSVDSTLGTYVVPAFAGLGAPYWDADARGAVIGLTQGVTREHLIRATLESLAYQSRDLVEAMVADSGRKLRKLRVDGGAAANDFLMQFQADILGTRVERPEVIETTAAGAAFLAGLGTGVFKSGRDIESAFHLNREFKPSMRPSLRKELCEGWRDAVGRVRTRA
jgi:glycerol kinase